jgi:hypothetical protein
VPGDDTERRASIIMASFCSTTNQPSFSLALTVPSLVSSQDFKVAPMLEVTHDETILLGGYTRLLPLECYFLRVSHSMNRER